MGTCGKIAKEGRIEDSIERIARIMYTRGHKIEKRRTEEKRSFSTGNLLCGGSGWNSQRKSRQFPAKKRMISYIEISKE